MTLTNLGQLVITCDIAEADVGQVKVFQPATVTLNALSNQQFAAIVTSVGTTGTTSSNVVTFPVTLTLTNPSGEVKVGMSASVSIVTQQLDNVLVVPSSAVNGSGTAGSTGSVTLVSSKGTQTRVPVVVGLQGTSTTGVYGNLKVGDKVLLPSVSISTATGNSGTSGVGGTGGAGFGGAGGAGGGLGRIFSGGGGFPGGGFRGGG